MPDGKDSLVPPSRDAASRIAALPRRCRDVLNGIVAGHSNKIIAYELGISPRTVEIHRAQLKRRLGARSVADAIYLAYEARYVCISLQRGCAAHRPMDAPQETFGEASPQQGDLFPDPCGHLAADHRDGE